MAVGFTIQTLTLLLCHYCEEPLFSDAMHASEFCDLIIYRSTLCPATRSFHVTSVSFLPGFHPCGTSTLQWAKTSYSAPELRRGLSLPSRRCSRPMLSQVSLDAPRPKSSISHDFDRLPVNHKDSKTPEEVLVQMEHVAIRDSQGHISFLNPENMVVRGGLVAELEDMVVSNSKNIRAARELRVGRAESTIQHVE